MTLTFDRRQVKTKWLLKLIERMRLEMLIEEVDFDEDIEDLGKEIKNSWWLHNKQRLIAENELSNKPYQITCRFNTCFSSTSNWSN